MSTTEVTDPVFLDATGLQVVQKLDDIAFVLKTQSLIPATGLTPAQIQAIVRSGRASEYFDIGDQIIVTWSDGTTEYDFPFDVVDFGNATLEDESVVPAMWLQSHYALPFATQFDATEAIYVVTDAALAAGVYYFTTPTGYEASYGGDGKSYYFTLQNSVPVGGCIKLTWGSNVPPSKVTTFASLSSTTAIEEATLTEGTSGTGLGTLNDTLGNVTTARYGYNNYEKSALRQYLNSKAAAGAWWTPQHTYDYICNYADKQGFMAGFSDEFLDILGKPVLKTAKNYITDGGTSAVPEYSTLADTFFVPSLGQHYFSSSMDEGSAWEYWKELSGSANPVSTSTTVPAFITTALNAKTSAQYVWLRSANRGSAYYEWRVGSSGRASSNTATDGYRCAPACCIC